MSTELVGTKTVDSIDSLRSLLAELAGKGDCYYFARWPHGVSGIEKAIDDLSPNSKKIPEKSFDGSPEGQMFSSKFEVRWKQKDQSYEVLLLHCEQSVSKWQFTPVGQNWKASDPLNTCFYDTDETRFPQEFQIAGKAKLHQRYFQDIATDTVHFVALMLAN
jgi:hypothetical protein